MNSLQAMFTAILNMSITASYVAVGVMLLRVLLRKAPKLFSYAIWAAVLFRLVCPWTFSTGISILGLLNVDAQNHASMLEYVPRDIGFMQTPAIQTGIGSLDGTVNASLPQATPIASVNPMQIWMQLLSLIWLAGILVLLAYSVFAYIKIKRRLQTATLVQDNVYESDRIGTAFVCGLLHPKIYIPVGVGAADLPYILEHERTHIRRKDHLLKPMAFCALILHWFNPLMWLSFALMSRDMEMSCDESVLQRMSQDARRGYSGSLLSLSVKQSGLFAANPLAFGESHVKARIHNVLNYKKPVFWVTILAVVALAVSIVAFSTNPKTDQTVPESYSGYAIEALLANKAPYVGDNSKVVGLVDAMPLPAGIVRDTVALQTSQVPYEITIHYVMKDASGNLVNGALSGDAFYRNAAMLFSLIDNVDVIHFSIADQIGQHDGAVYTMTMTREMAEQWLGEDVRPYSSSADMLKKLIDRINQTPIEASFDSPTNVGAQIEAALEVIMSSPMESSNSQDYIDAHPAEYAGILNLGDEALTYMMAQFEQGSQNGLKGHIMMALCKDLLGDRNNVTEVYRSPQEWYNALSYAGK
jgi:beta-lactamase regulating signal transducer with metallopeptidase domain